MVQCDCFENLREGRGFGASGFWILRVRWKQPIPLFVADDGVALNLNLGVGIGQGGDGDESAAGKIVVEYLALCAEGGLE
jgi:hypothetical protein